MRSAFSHSAPEHKWPVEGSLNERCDRLRFVSATFDEQANATGEIWATGSCWFSLVTLMTDISTLVSSPSVTVELPGPPNCAIATIVDPGPLLSMTRTLLSQVFEILPHICRRYCPSERKWTDTVVVRNGRISTALDEQRHEAIIALGVVHSGR